MINSLEKLNSHLTNYHGTSTDASGSKLKSIIFSCLYLFFVFLQCVLIFCFTLIKSLPSNNDLQLMFMNSYLYHSMDFIIPVLIAIINSHIYPFLVYRIGLNHDQKSLILLYTKTIVNIVVPVFVAYLLSNRCLKYWITFWDPCSNENKQGFNVKQNYYPFQQLVGSDDICGLYLNVDDCARDIFRILNDLTIRKLLVQFCISPAISLIDILLRSTFSFQIPFFAVDELILKFMTEWSELFSILNITIFLGFEFPLLMILCYAVIVARWVLLKVRLVKCPQIWYSNPIRNIIKT